MGGFSGFRWNGTVHWKRGWAGAPEEEEEEEKQKPVGPLRRGEHAIPTPFPQYRTADIGMIVLYM